VQINRSEGQAPFAAIALSRKENYRITKLSLMYTGLLTKALVITLCLAHVGLAQVKEISAQLQRANSSGFFPKQAKLHFSRAPLSATERHVLPALSPQEIEKIQDAGPEASGVVRALPVPLHLTKIVSEFPSERSAHIAGGLAIQVGKDKLVWGTYIQSQGAKELRVFFQNGYLPEGCQIYVYDDTAQVFTYSFSGSIQEGGFWSNILTSDHAFVELQISPPAFDSLNLVQLSITQIAHIEYSLLNINDVSPLSAPLEDVNCSYANQFSFIDNLKSATARVSYVREGVTGYGSGALLRNARGDSQPFFLTANHVVSSQTIAQTVVVLFDYRSTSCRGSVQLGTQVLGANLCATNTTNDFTLLLLKQKVPTPRVYLDWTTASVSGGTILHSVHHPWGGSQQYTRAEKSNSALECTGGGFGPAVGGPNYYMKLQGGGVRDGSSGSVVVNPNGQVVGQLRAVCGSDILASYLIVVGRFDESYNNSGLSYWLVTGAQARISAESLTFGTTQVGSYDELNSTISNTSTVSNGLNLETSTAYITGTNSTEFSIVSGAGSLYIPPTENKTIRIRFSPTSVGSNGSKSATLNIPHNASNLSSPLAVPLTGTASNPIPSISSVSPSSRTVGGSAFTLTVNGSGFVNGSIIRWGGSNRTTTFVSSTQLRASISTNDIGTAGTVNVTVFNSSPGGGTSGASSFTVNNPTPSIGSLSPISRTAGSSGFTLTVNGSNFVNGSTVRWNNSSRTTTFVTSTQLTASIPSSDIVTAGTSTVTVFNTTPGGGTSGSSVFTINNPVPTITSLAPDSVTAGGPGFTLTVDGSGFVNGSVVRWNGSGRTTNYISTTQLTASITAGDIAATTSGTVTVFNSSPGGGVSNSQPFKVVSSVERVSLDIPNDYQLSQNFPNPFNPSTTMKFSIPRQSHVVLTIFNSLGMEIEIIVNGNLSPGYYEAQWTTLNLPSGVYFYRLQAGAFAETRKLILLK
jgi:hypothetical protein